MPEYLCIFMTAYRRILLIMTNVAGKNCRRNLKKTFLYRVSRGNMPHFGRMFLTLKYTDLTKKHLYPKLNGYGDNGERSLKV